MKLIRRHELTSKLVIVDGVPGCGKSMLSAVVCSLDRVELLKYSYDIEQLCELHHLGLIDENTCAQMLRMHADLITYNLMMSRDINFRFSDLSSIFKSASPLKYIIRAFREGDLVIPERIANEKPITYLATHALLPFCRPLFIALNERLVFIKFHRHPLYMLKQNEWNMGALIGNPRHWTLYVSGRDSGEIPFYAADWEDTFKTANPKEKAIFYIQWLRKREIEFKRNNPNSPVIEITFESFVMDPFPHLDMLCDAIGTTLGVKTKKVLKRENIPRTVLGAGRDVPIYRRVGWSPPKRSSTNEELDDLRRYAISDVSQRAQEAVEWLCDDYSKISRMLEADK